ncbi:MAG: bifunctional folylpolyglutamate synthase/dihydrofolate synthase [Erysipelotrichales bacterium]|nr:bifunctional folylpolyglutamate synthase/dihydrofolate synthase [Erysipelotrichales bacterium]
MIDISKFKTAKAVIDWIENIKRFAKRESLDRMKEALNALGNPLAKTKKIHIGGTNGKGSTASFVASILKENKIKTGLFISPYIIIFNERISIDGDYISDEALIRLGNKLYNLSETFLKEKGEIITFFEILTLLAFLYFEEEAVEVAIIEVGIGGLLDATNAARYDLAVITNIGWDHMAQLGNTLELIATNKLGIVKDGNHLITGADLILKQTFENYVKNTNATVKFVNEKAVTCLSVLPTVFSYENERFELSMIGIHQAHNAALALEAVRYLFSFSEESIRAGLKKTFWPGRMELVSKEPAILLDGAHNISGIDALVKTIKVMKPKEEVVVVFCVMHDKEYSKMLEALKTVSNQIILTEIDYKRSLRAEDLPETVSANIDLMISNYQEAISYVMAIKNKTIIFTGSLYFISEVRKNFLK